MTEDDEDLPASKIVEQFGDDIKAAIAEIVDQTPTIAKSAAAAVVKDEASKRSVHWYLVTIAVAWIGAAAIVWLVIGRAPSEWLIHHADGLVETCVLTPEGGRATFVCRLPEAPPR